MLLFSCLFLVDFGRIWRWFLILLLTICADDSSMCVHVHTWLMRSSYCRAPCALNVVILEKTQSALIRYILVIVFFMMICCVYNMRVPLFNSLILTPHFVSLCLRALLTRFLSSNTLYVFLTDCRWHDAFEVSQISIVSNKMILKSCWSLSANKSVEARH
jgi:hypothetical protein